jgi:acetyl/propionyl-CoA carboxylase alpha subunit
MTHRKLLVANRGEIAVRVLRAARELGVATLAVYSEDDARSQHRMRADAAHALRGRGAQAYLDIPQLIAAAVEHGCDAVHPGYGFLSESAAFASACAEAKLAFVGPKPETLSLLGDKTRARALARALDVPVLPGQQRGQLGRGAGILRGIAARQCAGDQGRVWRRWARHACGARSE